MASLFTLTVCTPLIPLSKDLATEALSFFVFPVTRFELPAVFAATIAAVETILLDFRVFVTVALRTWDTADISSSEDFTVVILGMEIQLKSGQALVVSLHHKRRARVVYHCLARVMCVTAPELSRASCYGQVDDSH